MAEFLREPMGVVGRELSVGLVLNSSELRLSEPSLKPLLMELLSSQLKETRTEMISERIRGWHSGSFCLRFDVFAKKRNQFTLK